MGELFNIKKENSELEMNELFKLEMKYFEKFKQAIPREMIPASITNEDIIIAIKECLETNNSEILSVLNININKNILY